MHTLKNYDSSAKNLSPAEILFAGSTHSPLDIENDAPWYAPTISKPQNTTHRARPMPQIEENFSAKYLASKISELRKISPILISEIEQDYADRGGLYNPQALFEIQKYWKEHLQTEMMLEDLRLANAVTPKFEAELRHDKEIPFKLMAVYERWLKIRPLQY